MHRATLSPRQRALARGLHPGRKAAYVCVDGQQRTRALYTAKAVKAAFLALQGRGVVTLGAFTSE